MRTGKCEECGRRKYNRTLERHHYKLIEPIDSKNPKSLRAEGRNLKYQMMVNGAKGMKTG